MYPSQIEVNSRLGREVGVEKTIYGTFICEFADFNNPHPSQLVGDTEEIAYSNLLSYLKRRDDGQEKTTEQSETVQADLDSTNSSGDA